MTTHQAVEELIQTAFLFNGGEGDAGGYILRPKDEDDPLNQNIDVVVDGVFFEGDSRPQTPVGLCA